jgi:thioredoxin-related protein
MKPLLYIAIYILFVGCQSPWRKDITKEYRSLPNFAVQLQDSSTLLSLTSITKNHSTILLYFAPDCEHCQIQIANLLENSKYFNDTKIVFISMAATSDISKFSAKFHIGEYPNVIVGRDYQYEFYNLFKITSFPNIFIYNKSKHLTKVYRGQTEIQRIDKALRS